jgi:PBP1b-binding outer membrane lipoprotein LpoB
MIKLASLVVVAVALAGCAVDGRDPEPADQTQPAPAQPTQEETKATEQAPPPVVDTGTTTNVLKTRHETK